ncbi:ribosome biogenesis GTPase YlqF [Limosilactobacillus fastidiosus]|uniref:Ribosome biogenesis GTPase A n=1 Tax=Limosilactobacillus fastidiosus TaxID=2759855 RepID=A0A7W3U0Q7_9LACO|nr:ribosome biogenesis GTPase YlqF [Limosilactobacillus fastidiosus]MBB1062740.1 ribosome biogenesis GTPase YlqF [Limosilactobacillus fastidiosus]MBB1086525.1 ribosome biogenesis GTPase YlqF [Limosilactobacillus fastidiosus]MCD7084847.1 ribosome biogenesis GTPase YlqF [Limosilactobacillus fastidiosus]MCD7085123.1 ribosome biogenesis GTPase YlqF [Limosilactobacillus fastidiosus]MCD7115113.1 ribosome biogenesis GTPase YlqF [Limosilactobacillus fastidiosus]
MATIQWFPGHMAKALRQIREQMPLVDIVFELVDARVPYSSQNPEIALAAGEKPRLLIMTKTDLADPKRLNEWLTYFKEHHQPVLALDSRQQNVSKIITAKSKEILHDKLVREATKGMKKRPIRAMSVGVPNVGKSTLLNHLVKKNVAVTGNRPGVTTGQQWLRSSNELELLDTPGVLWHKFASQKQGTMLALSGAIKDSLYAKDDVALFALNYLRHQQPDELKKRYRLTDADLDENVSDPDLLLKITEKMGFRDDYDRASERLIFDLRKGKLGAITMEIPADLNEDGVNE